MLAIERREHFQQVAKFAATRPPQVKATLGESLTFLAHYADHERQRLTRCRLYPDFAPFSFYFVMDRKDDAGNFKPWFNGGLIFHGAIDGYGSGSAPTFSVCVELCDGWSIHT